MSQESGETRLFKPEMVALDKKGLTMADVMVGIGAGGEATLVIANHGAAPVQLPVGEIMGRLALQATRRPQWRRAGEVPPRLLPLQ